jgi:HPt (histidine-containing phosphotransfer) domain-containing protein
MESAEDSSLAQAMEKLWIRFLPQMQERLTTMEAANAAIAAGKLSQDHRTAANAAAHNLAGVLGTFGLTRGTVLAREAEVIYAGDIGTDRDALTTLRNIAAELRALIAAHK